MATAAIPTRRRGPVLLPEIKGRISPELEAILDRYRTAWPSNEDDAADRWDEAARDIANFVPKGLADAAAKLMFGLHYLHPTSIGDALAIDCEHFEVDTAADILLSSLQWHVDAAADPHMGWLAERDAVWSEYNGYKDDDEARDEPLAAKGRELEHRIIETPATTRDGILAKALLIVGANCEPFSVNTADEQSVFDEAKAMGLVEWES